MSLVDEFKKSLESQNSEVDRLNTAIILLKVCREYINIHYEKAVFGKYQKKLVDVIDTFIRECQ